MLYAIKLLYEPLVQTGAKYLHNKIINCFVSYTQT